MEVRRCEERGDFWRIVAFGFFWESYWLLGGYSKYGVRYCFFGVLKESLGKISGYFLGIESDYTVMI